VLGDHQHLRGYCLLLADPVVPRLNDLHGPNRRQFLDDMAMFGDVVLTVTGALRINYEILGNLDPVLHAHLIPRYADEPADLRSRPAWFYDEATMREHPFEPTLHRALMQAIHDELVARGAVPDTLA